ncbi:MAG TPA: cupin domain-containing protein [Vicinamibacteria bacterium]|nr:cupin domain-containing protein [Vicinamibacteria bacterium]
MKHFVVIASFAIAGSMAFDPSQETKPRTLPDLESIIAAAIAEGAPVDSIGMESSILGTIPLDAYVDTLKDGDFRLREVVLLPGAKVRVHGHNERPVIAYVLEGEIVEHRSDSEHPLVRRKGDSYFEGPGLVHWVENLSSHRVRIISVDIVPDDAP